ncbi:pre-mRNA splicing factor ATP-dependent RNA helicase PRP43 [Fusarium agapanthi]|uniref:Pre-mRNA splicing factor ATP-dependent RNA helicase PRP43 n=1 Tax=Fusarium agapanthi TaxID=1803897 RepID=A0A9P5AZY5_9HYPO|nr:pre-mRNA splicing factor ATP-dependent RNA helicase PRP43 [Fusarium agapanthi]
MENLKRNETTAAEAAAIEDGKMNPFIPGQEYSENYLQIHQDRCQKLPIRSQRQEFLDKYHSEQVTIVCGDAGSGKTTQISQFVLFDEWESGLRVACTQPRRVAATGVAARVAQEMDVPLGGIVGYRVRFDKKSSRETRLEFLTDGLLLKTHSRDLSLSQHACIIIDEAHERTTNTDMLLALLKKIIQQRKDLKVVIMSATINLEKFCQYYGTTNIFDTNRQVHTVQINYAEASPKYYDEAVVAAVTHIVNNRPKGDILVFITSITEVERTCDWLRSEIPAITVLPMYSSLPKASARQRAGRAGRTESGECYRLYTKEFHDRGMIPNTPPSIHLNEVSGEVLLLKSLSYEDVPNFDWLDPPHPETYLRAIGDLRDLGYINDRCGITHAGRQAATLSVHCVWYNCFRKAHELDCLGQIIAIAALMSTQADILTRPYQVRYAADVVHRTFDHPESDIVGRMNALSCYWQMSKDLSEDELLGWCNEYFVNHRVATEVLAIRRQLLGHVQRNFLANSVPLSMLETDEKFSENIRKSLLAGFFTKTAMFDSRR